MLDDLIEEREGGLFEWKNGEEGLNKWRVSQNKLESKNIFGATRVRRLMLPVKIPILIAFNFIISIVVPVESFRGSWFLFSF